MLLGVDRSAFLGRLSVKVALPGYQSQGVVKQGNFITWHDSSEMSLHKKIFVFQPGIKIHHLPPGKVGILIAVGSILGIPMLNVIPAELQNKHWQLTFQANLLVCG